MLRLIFHDTKERQMKRTDALVADSRIVFEGISQYLDEPTNVLEFMGMYKPILVI